MFWAVIMVEHRDNHVVSVVFPFENLVGQCSKTEIPDEK